MDYFAAPLRPSRIFVAKAKPVIACYGVGLTQHRSGALAIQMLMRGNIGKDNMMDGPAKALAEDKDVNEFHLGMSSEGARAPPREHLRSPRAVRD